MPLLRSLCYIFQVKTIARDENTCLIGLLCKSSEMTGIKYLTICNSFSSSLIPLYLQFSGIFASLLLHGFFGK